MTTSTLEDRLSIAVTFDPARGYIASHPELQTFTALSLNGLRKKIEEALLPEIPIIILDLDRQARVERDQRRSRAR